MSAINFHQFPVGSKIESVNKDGYFIMAVCGYVVKHLPDGHAIVKNFDDVHFSTVGRNVAEAYVL